MNKQQAQQIIRDTFENSFNKSGFTGFVKNLLNRIDGAPFTYQGNYIPDAYKQYIKTLERIGKISDGENNIDILVITLQKETSLERARTMQRNFVAWYLNGSRGGEMKDAALAAFVSPDESDWRFSLVKMDYKFEKTKTGKMKVKEEFTPARRWSFLVGANEKSHTAQSRLVNILADDEQAPILEEIEKAFDIETVTKEFFLKYRELFLRTKEELDKVVKKNPKVEADFEAKSVDTVNFAKKLLGQIIFLYFLQKKGWFGVGRDDDWGTGSKHFLRELFNKKHADYINFYNDILEPLFYEALRTGEDRKHEDYYYSRFDCKIPFLNGGLFDPIGNYDWVHTDMLIPDKLFSNNVKTKEGDIGTGILDVFDRYNFTVKEDEPLEKEVAIDPELLGKSYEKFNAIRPDNYDEFRKALKSGKTGDENKFNKKFGVYYTPREIVHYMCQQSLINYLATELTDFHSREGGNPVVSKEDIENMIHTGEQVSENEARVISKGKETKTYSHQLPESIRKNAKLIDEKLADITVCDPAVGSGAFPVGMMGEIVRARNVLSTFVNDKNRTPYEFKRRCIEHSLYGVDIDPGAVEIAKLRLWLSLVVDEDDIKNIKPLPNLDYRIMQGNSLISEFMGISFDEDENKNLKRNIEDLDIEIKGLEKESAGKQSEFSRYYNKTRKQDQNLLNKINKLADIINTLKKKRTQLIKKLNNPQDEDSEIINTISEFQKTKNSFLNESNVSRKSKLKEEVDDLLVKIFETKLKSQKSDYFNRLKNIENKYSVLRNEKQRDELIKQDKEKLYKETGFNLESAEKQLKEFTSGRKIKPFFLWNLYFSEVFHNKGGFDVMIANPPYVSVEKFARTALQTEWKRKFKTYASRGDIYCFFYEQGLALLHRDGVLTFISSNKFQRAGYGKGLRHLLATHQIQTLIDFCELPVFAAAADPIIVVVMKSAIPTSHKFPVLVVKDESEFGLLRQTLDTRASRYRTDQLKAEGWSLDGESGLALIDKLRAKGIPLANYVKPGIMAGIKTGYNKAFWLDISIAKELSKLDPVAAQAFLKPLIVGDDARRWYCKPVSTYLIYIPRGIQQKRIGVFGKHLSKWRTRLEKRALDQKWFELQQAQLRYSSTWSRPKIVYPDITLEPRFSIDDSDRFPDMTAFTIPSDDRALLALLNSTTTWFFLRRTASILGDADRRGRVRCKTQYVSQIPIPSSSPADKSRLTQLAEHAAKFTEVGDSAGVAKIEKEINQLVYKLYDLTPEEIKTVEGKNENPD